MTAGIRHLVVYGTLRSDAPAGPPGRPDLVGRVRPVGPVLLAGVLHDAGGYPVLVHDVTSSAAWTASAGGTVRAELLELLDGSLLAELDAYEELDPAAGSTSEYQRISIAVPEHGVDAWLYCAPRAIVDLPVIVSGDWLAR